MLTFYQLSLLAESHQIERYFFEQEDEEKENYNLFGPDNSNEDDEDDDDDEFDLTTISVPRDEDIPNMVGPSRRGDPQSRRMRDLGPLRGLERQIAFLNRLLESNYHRRKTYDVLTSLGVDVSHISVYLVKEDERGKKEYVLVNPKTIPGYDERNDIWIEKFKVFSKMVGVDEVKHGFKPVYIEDEETLKELFKRLWLEKEREEEPDYSQGVVYARRGSRVIGKSRVNEPDSYQSHSLLKKILAKKGEVSKEEEPKYDLAFHIINYMSQEFNKFLVPMPLRKLVNLIKSGVKRGGLGGTNQYSDREIIDALLVADKLAKGDFLNKLEDGTWEVNFSLLEADVKVDMEGKFVHLHGFTLLEEAKRKLEEYARKIQRSMESGKAFGPVDYRNITAAMYQILKVLKKESEVDEEEIRQLENKYYPIISKTYKEYIDDYFETALKYHNKKMRDEQAE